VTVTTNVYGGTLVVKNKDEEEILRQPFEQRELSSEIELMPGENYTFLAEAAGLVAIENDRDITDSPEIELTFMENQLSELYRAAGCLLLIPNSGFGSGFLLGDRETIATAAHCVACENVNDLKVVFHPTEPTEFEIQGVRLIYFDAKQDVALLHLPDPVPDTHPYFWTPRSAEKDDKVVVLGNPGRAGYPDPMYSRSAQVKGTRPDEFFIDIEVKPGYSGGPVILENSMDAVGITSFKHINTKKYEDDGQSFARSADIASDAFTHWSNLSSALQDAKLEREAKRYAERYHYVEADEVGTALFLDSFRYLIAVIDVIKDYNRHMKLSLSHLPNPVSAVVLRREERKAHREYLKEKGPEKAKEIKERISSNLLMENGHQERYDALLEDPDLPQDMKEHLEKAHEHYLTIREALEKIVDPSGRATKGKTLEEFVEFIVDEFEDAQYHCRQVIIESERRLE
jgi:hypothetical protein